MEDRRTFLETAGGLLLLKPETVFGSQANSAIEVGIVGMGGRGNWIAGHFKEHTGARIAAIADPFPDRLDAGGQKFNVDPARRYKGLDAYRELVHSKLDA